MTVFQTPYGTVDAPSLEAAQKWLAGQKANPPPSSEFIEPPSPGAAVPHPAPSSAAAKPWVNDAGQTVYQPGVKTPADEGYTGSILPFRRDAGGLHLAVPDILASPVRGALEAGKALTGRGPPPGSRLSPDVMAAEAPFASPLRFGVGGALARSPVTAVERPSPDILRQQRYAERARALVSGAFEKGAEGGAPTAVDTLTEFGRARQAQQPLALVDVPSQPVQKLASQIYRRGGAGASQIRSFLEKREAGSMGRSERLINMGISDRPLSATAEELAQQRSLQARPVWDEVKRGGSTAPLATQFEGAFQDSLKAKEAALVAVRQARVRATQASARSSQAGNVYSANAAGRARQEAETQLRGALDHLDAVTRQSENIRGRLQKAIADKTANAPGAVWSPRLQQLLDQPELKRGLRRGWDIERRRAIGEGRPFYPSEYAITGLDKNGEPIVGQVPNMALLMVAKEGLDHMIQSSASRDALTGRLNKVGASYAALRDGLVRELDQLNPAYRAARNMWSGQTQSIEALHAGQALLGGHRFPQIEDAEKFYAELTDNDKEFFKIGVATDLKNRLYKNRTINTEDVKRRLHPLFKSEQEATDFIDALERERAMRRTGAQIRGIAQQPDSEHDASQIALHAAHGLGNLLHGRYIRSALSAMRLRRLLGQRTNPELDLEIARLLTNPDIPIRDTGPAIPRQGQFTRDGRNVTWTGPMRMRPPQ